jgi:hypothetical protein
MTEGFFSLNAALFSYPAKDLTGVRTMRKIFLVIGVILAAFMVLLIGTHMYQEFYGNRCTPCQPFFGAAARDGGSLLLVVRHEPCEPAICNPCGANADSIRSLNISVLPDGGRQFFIEPSIKINEAIILPGVMANSSGNRVTASARYYGWENTSCNLTIVDTRV